MVRPRYDSNTPTARERLADAFWDLVVKDSIDSITVAGLSRAAGVSHNTFYYHFANIEDMAEELVSETSFPDLARHLLEDGWGAPTSGMAEEMRNADTAARFMRFCTSRIGSQPGTDQRSGSVLK